jgi:general secretion pathway protein E
LCLGASTAAGGGASAIKRMDDLGIPAFLVADATKLIMSQRLVRRLCLHCGKQEGNPQFLATAMEFARRGGLDWAAMKPRFRRPVGCGRCGTTGYQGQMPIAETLLMTPEVAGAIRRGAAVDELRAVVIGQGMTTMAADGIRKAAEGLTSIEEIVRVVGVAR